MKEYLTYCFNHEPDWKEVPVGKIDVFQWESEEKYRPETVFQLCLIRNKGIFLKMKTDETKLRITCKDRDDPCWQDSCMEFFFRPFADKEEYINIEMNPAGTYLSEIGKGKGDRRFVKELTTEEVTISTEVTENGWSLSLLVPDEFIKALYGKSFDYDGSEFYANFYKCGDLTERPHYGSFSPMSTLPPGFHNPKHFAKIKFSDSK